MRNKFLVLVGSIALVLVLITPAGAQVAPERRDGRFILGVEIGPQFATADSTAFGVAFSGDYFISQNFSIGPLIQFGVTPDFFQFGPTVQLKYTHDIDLRLKGTFQGGIGFIYAELDRPRRRDRDDTSFLIPLGPGVEYRLTDGISLSGTLLFNFTDLREVRNERFFLSLLGGVRVRF